MSTGDEFAAPVQELSQIIDELLDAHADTVCLADRVGGEDGHGAGEWNAHVQYLRDLQRVGKGVAGAHCGRIAPFQRNLEPGRSEMVTRSLPPAPGQMHAYRATPAPCPACMRAAQRRLAAHNAFSEAAAREWELGGRARPRGR